MNDCWLVFRKEWKGFAKSDGGVFIIYGILILMWSILISLNSNLDDSRSDYIWLVFFSVIVSGNFSNTTFVAERMIGSLEILLTSGLSRMSILSGKILFIVFMSTILGILCYTIAFCIDSFNKKIFEAGIFLNARFWREIVLYTSACYLNATSSAWLSLKISNPRLTHFINFFIVGFIIVVHALLSDFLFLSMWFLTFSFILLGICFTFLAYKQYKSEKVIQPIIL